MNGFVILILICGIISCKNEEVNMPTTPYLYSPSVTYDAEQVGQIFLHPAHRTGPLALPTESFSNLPLTISIPKNAPQPLPVVIYSHGGGARNTPGQSGTSWAIALAKAGYAVIAMHHMSRSPEDVKLNICGPLGVAPGDCDAAVYVPYYESTDRPQDAICVMDSLSAISQAVGYSFDATRICIFGFSGGTNTTHYLSGGVRNATYGVSPDTNYFSMPDSRPKGYVAMSSGAGTQGGWTSGSLKGINSPFICATGLADLSGEIRAEFYDQMQGDEQYRLYINSASAEHVTFNHEVTGPDMTQQEQQVFHTWLEASVIAFLDAYVNDQAEAREWLRSDNVPAIVNDYLNESTLFPTWSYR